MSVTLAQHRIDITPAILCVVSTGVAGDWLKLKPSQRETLAQCRPNVGSQSTMLDKYWVAVFLGVLVMFVAV